VDFVARRVELADFAFAVSGKLKEALRQLDRLVLRLRVQDREPAGQLLGIRERAVGDGDLVAGFCICFCIFAMCSGLGGVFTSRVLGMGAEFPQLLADVSGT
jgi:hypothetical protein